MYELNFHPTADLDFIEAIIWYETQQEKLGIRFSEAVNDTQKNPKDAGIISFGEMEFQGSICARFPLFDSL